MSEVGIENQIYETDHGVDDTTQNNTSYCGETEKSTEKIGAKVIFEQKESKHDLAAIKSSAGVILNEDGTPSSVDVEVLSYRSVTSESKIGIKNQIYETDHGVDDTTQNNTASCGETEKNTTNNITFEQKETKHDLTVIQSSAGIILNENGTLSSVDIERVSNFSFLFISKLA